MRVYTGWPRGENYCSMAAMGGLQLINPDGDLVAHTDPRNFHNQHWGLVQWLTNDVYLANLHRVGNISR